MHTDLKMCDEQQHPRTAINESKMQVDREMSLGTGRQ